MGDQANTSPRVSSTDGSINSVWNDLLTQTGVLEIKPVSGTGDQTEYLSKKFFGATFSPSSALTTFDTDQSALNEAFKDGNLLLLGLKSIGTEQSVTDETTLPNIDNVLTAFGIGDKVSLPVPLNYVVKSLKNKVLNSTLPTFRIDETKTKNSRNGIWIGAEDFGDLEVITALSLRIKSISQTLKLADGLVSALQSQFGISISTDSLDFPLDKLPTFRLKNRTRAFKDEDGKFVIDSTFEFNVQMPVKGFILSFTTDSSGELRFAVLDNPAVTEGLFTKIKALLQNAPTDTVALPQDEEFVSEPTLWAMAVTKNASGFSWSIGFIVKMKLLDLTSRIALTYDSASGTFQGMLLLKNMTYARLLPDFVEANEIPDGNSLPDGLDLRKSEYFKTSLPDSIPTVITDAFISFRKKTAGSPASLSLSTTIESSSEAEPDPTDIPNPIDWNRITFDFVKEGSNLAMSIYTSFQLNPPSVTKRFSPGTLAVQLLYVKDATATGTTPSSTSSWQFSASARNIQMGAIAEWFDPDLSDEVLDLVGSISIQQLDMMYTYETKKASSFLISGTVILGPMQLSLYYQYAKTSSVTPAIKNVTSDGNRTVPAPVKIPSGQTSAWELDAYLDPTSKDLSVGDIIDAILDGPSAGSDNIPDFVRNIKIKSNQPNDHLISLKVRKIPGTIPRVVFILDVNTSDIQFSFMQISGGSSSTGRPPTGNPASPSKRILRISVGRIPLLQDLPVVKELPQPFDKLQYMWVVSESLTRPEVDMINKYLTPSTVLYFKATSTDLKAPILLKGHHFIVVNDGVAILDHVYTPDTKRKPKSNQGIRTTSLAASTATKPTQVSPTTPSTGPLRKQTKFLDITALSLEYKDSKLWLYLDATLTLGPLAFTLIGFGVGFDIKGLTLDNLLNVVDTLEFQLRGMAVSFDKPPIMIAGVFEVVTVASTVKVEKCYRGGVCLQVPPYAFVAVGEYAEVIEYEGEGAARKSKTYKSVFIFAKLDGPLLDLQFAKIKGVRMGFGVNNLIRSPAVQELSQFPLISDTSAAGTGNNPMLILNNMRKGDNPWIQTKEDNYWLAFGFTLSSFDLINATCVALVSFRDSGPIFSIYGVLIGELPPNTPQGMKLAYIEIMMNAELNLATDCFIVQASLSPASYIYCPQAHLQGGFAMYSFFGRHPNAGDWVFTIGGYHRRFQAPSHYPVVDRLGLNFSIGIISIRGLGYFAITPKAMMAGALLHCELNIGPVFAYLDAGFDAMIIFHPLHYWIDMHVDVGVQCNIPMLFVTIRISIHIGAELHIEGPEFGGDAYVDFWFFSFHIPFGARSGPAAPLSLLEFYQLCLRGGPKDEPTNTRTKVEGDLNVRLKFNLEDGVFTLPPVDKEKDATGKEIAKQDPSSEGAGTKWFVKGGNFKFRVSTVFAMSSAWIETPQSAKAASEAKPALTNLYQHANLTDSKDKDKKLLQKVTPEPPNTGTVYAFPMQTRTPVDSPLYLGITSDGGEEINVSEGWKVEYIVQAMPATLWANPASPPNPLSAEKGTVDQRMAIAVSAPDPILAVSKIPQFNASDMARACAGTNPIPGTDKIGDQRPKQLVFLPATLDEVTTKDAAQDWPKFQDMWKTTAKAKADTAMELVKACTALLAWDKPSPDVMQLAEQATGGANVTPWAFDAAFPTRLVTGTAGLTGADPDVKDGFQNYYLELPRISAVAT